MRGRKPKNPDLDLKLGERADRIKPAKAAPVEGKPVPPDHLDAVAREEFQKIVDDMEQQGTLSRTDGRSIAIYAECFARWIRAKSILATLTEDYITLPSGVVKQHPVHETINKAVSQMTRLLIEFGMTSQSRKKVPVNKPKDTSGDKWQGLV